MFLRNMKIQVISLLCLLLLCSCQISQQAQTNKSSNELTVEKEQNLNTNDNLKSEKEKPKVFSEIEFSKSEIKRKGRGDEMTINIEYPRIKTPETTPQKKFNQKLQSLVQKELNEFVQFCSEAYKKKQTSGCEINSDFDIEYASKKFVSAKINWQSYSGYLNYDYHTTTVNYNLTNEKDVELKDLFEKNTNYLEKLSRLAIEKLNRTCLSCPCKDGTNAGKSLPEGISNAESFGGMFDLNEAVSAKEENFSNWSITAEGLKITFNEYQVGPGCIGIIDIVIPFNDLQPILRKDLNFN
jgi:hypothetical protein